MTDKQTQQNVLRELDWEPQVKSTDIGVAVTDGVVTLSGFIESYDQKYHAEQAAKRVYGVRALANDLEVKPGAGGQRADPDIAHAAAHALEQRITVPHERIKMTVRDGWITLEGEVNWKYQSDAAGAAVRHLTGVKGVTNLIEVKPHASAVEVQSRIEEALRRSAELDARGITVEATDSKVVLRGNVRSWFEKEEAEQAAWRAHGVAKVENRIAIVP
jgi:osmotically-inducible protein OsmY